MKKLFSVKSNIVQKISKRSFSIIEVCIAIVIFTCVCLPLFKSITNTYKYQADYLVNEQIQATYKEAFCLLKEALLESKIIIPDELKNPLVGNIDISNKSAILNNIKCCFVINKISVWVHNKSSKVCKAKVRILFVNSKTNKQLASFSKEVIIRSED